MIEKKCCMCNQLLPINNFYFRKDRQQYHCRCKQCEKKYQFNYIKINKEALKQKHKEYYEINKNNKIQYQKEYYQNHKQEKRLYDVKYKEQTKTKRNAKENFLYSNDLLYRFKKQVRNLIYKSFKRKEFAKSMHTKEIIGCDYDTFINHLLKTYKDNYKCEWNGEELIHIDHIIPLATAQTKEDVIKLCYYTNLQLLKAKDNLKKSNKLNFNGREVD